MSLTCSQNPEIAGAALSPLLACPRPPGKTVPCGGVQGQSRHFIDCTWQLHSNYFALFSSLFCWPKPSHNNKHKLKFGKGDLRCSRPSSDAAERPLQATPGPSHLSQHRSLAPHKPRLPVGVFLGLCFSCAQPSDQVFVNFTQTRAGAHGSWECRAGTPVVRSPTSRVCHRPWSLCGREEAFPGLRGTVGR